MFDNKTQQTIAYSRARIELAKHETDKIRTLLLKIARPSAKTKKNISLRSIHKFQSNEETNIHLMVT